MRRQLRSISPTQLRTYDTCPLQYRMRYVDRVPTADSPASLVGQAVHAALEQNFAVKRRSGHDLDLDEAAEVFDDVWAARLPPGAGSEQLAEDFDQAYASGQEILSCTWPKSRPVSSRTSSSTASDSRFPVSRWSWWERSI